MYLDEDGKALPPKHGRSARYKIEPIGTGEECALFEKKGARWSSISSGKQSELLLFLSRKRITVPEQSGGFSSEIVKELAPIVGYLPGMSAKQINNYIYVLLSRNRVSERNRIINTRLVDSFGQPIYVLDAGDFDAPVTLRRTYLVDSVSKARWIFYGVTQTQLPPPLQWSDNVADYIWHPELEILNTREDRIYHIMTERSDRIRNIVATLDAPTILRNVREAIHTGQQLACRDCTYALPFYSRKYDRVNMLLPLHIYTKDTELPEAVMLFNTTSYGYALGTIITPQQAYMGVRAFRDPEMTWLKGAV